MRILFSAALLAATSATPALAQTNAPFTGARAEGVVGWDRVQADGGHEDGVVYGGQVGYDFQSGLGLVGIEGEVTGTSTDACDSGRASATPTLPQTCVKGGRDLYAGARIGTVIGGNTLLYAKAGYTNARDRLTSYDGTSTTTLTGRNLDGVRVGAGIEHNFGPRVYGKAEYRYSNYQDDVSRHQVLAGVGVRF